MNQLFKLNNDKGWKTLLITDNSLLFVNKSYNNEEEFLEKFNEKGLFKERLDLSLLDVTKLTHAEKQNSSAVIHYSSKFSTRPQLLVFQNETAQQEFVQNFTRLRQFSASTNHVSVLKAITSPLIGLAVTAFLTWVVYMDAQIIESGGEVNTSGRRSLYKKLFAWLAEQLGTQGSLIAGVAVAAICLYFIYKNLQNRPNEVVYS